MKNIIYIYVHENFAILEQILNNCDILLNKFEIQKQLIILRNEMEPPEIFDAKMFSKNIDGHDISNILVRNIETSWIRRI